MYRDIDIVHTPFYLVYHTSVKETLLLWVNPKISYTFVFTISWLSATSMYVYKDKLAIFSKTNPDNQSVKN